MHGKVIMAGRRLLSLTAMIMLLVILYGCGRYKPVSADAGRMGEAASGQEEIARGKIRTAVEMLETHTSKMELFYDRESGLLVCFLSMPRIPKSDDGNLYLFAEECYEDTEKLTGEPVAVGTKEKVCRLSFPCEEGYLFCRFVPALLIDGDYVPMREGLCLSNPQDMAENQDAYPQPESKKGLLLDPAMLYTEETAQLGIKHAIYNIPLSLIMGETTNDLCPTVEYMYQGTCYHFNGAELFAYDTLFTYLTDMGMCNTAIILNDWNEEHLEMIHPQARNEESGAYYYMFNTADEEGTRALEATASFLAERYSSGEHGMVHSWVIANEINQHHLWNYMETENLDYYAEEFEKAFRIFYQAIKSCYAGARVYYSIDHDWNSNEGDNSHYFNARDLIGAFDQAAKVHGNYDWGIAIHPYPNPLTRVNYWSQEYDKTMDADVLTIMNLSAVTDFFRQEAYLDTAGEVRSIAITELGFSSGAGEKLQAAAYAYCYYIAEANPDIDALILNRQTDAPEEMRQGLAFGIYGYDHSEKYVQEIFRWIDTKDGRKYTDFMLNILGADSLEEALSWAA